MSNSSKNSSPIRRFRELSGPMNPERTTHRAADKPVKSYFLRCLLLIPPTDDRDHAGWQFTVTRFRTRRTRWTGCSSRRSAGRDQGGKSGSTNQSQGGTNEEQLEELEEQYGSGVSRCSSPTPNGSACCRQRGPDFQGIMMATEATRRSAATSIPKPRPWSFSAVTSRAVLAKRSGEFGQVSPATFQ